MADRKGNSVERYYAAKQKRRKRRKIRVYFALVLISIAVFITLSLTVFFNIRAFDISGNSTYTNEQIIAAAGLKEGDNLFRLNKFKIADKMVVDLPFIEQVNIYRRLPTTLCIEVKETKASFVVYQDGQYILLSSALKVLGKTDKLPESIIYLVGDKLKDIQIGYPAAFENGSEAEIAAIAGTIESEFWTNKIAALDVSQKYSLRLYYDKGRIKILLGNTEYMNEKLQMAAQAIEKNSTTEYARIDITEAKAAYYRVLEEDEVDDLEAMLLGKAKAKEDKYYLPQSEQNEDAEQSDSDS